MKTTTVNKPSTSPLLTPTPAAAVKVVKERPPLPGVSMSGVRW